MRNATGDDKAAFIAAFPTERNISPAAMKKRIYRLNCSRKVQRYTKTLEEAFAAETMGKYIALKEWMIVKALASIEAKTATDPTGIANCRMEVHMLSKMLGWQPPPDVPAEDARHSPQAKTDEELKHGPVSERRMQLLRKGHQAQNRWPPKAPQLDIGGHLGHNLL